MKFRLARRLTAGLAVAAAFCLSPARSKADVQILVQEAGGAAQAPVSAVPDAAGHVSMNFATSNYSFSVSLTTNSGFGASFASLVPNINGIITGSGPLPDLIIRITDDNFTGANQAYTLKNSAGVSDGISIGAGTLQVNTQTALLGNPTPANGPDLVTGTTLATTDVASASYPPNASLISPTTSPVNSLDGKYAVQQTISLSFTGDIPQFSTFNGSGGVNVNPSPVPAPGGLALALIGLPLIGIRRALRKRAEVA